MVIEKAKNEARKLGGDAIKIVNHKPPTVLGSSCHRIEANILNLNNLAERVILDSLKNSNESEVKEKSFLKYRVSVNGGWSNRLAEVSEDVPDDLKEYVRELKTGYHYGIDITYFFSERAGFGFKNNRFNSENSLENIYLTLNHDETNYEPIRYRPLYQPLY